MRRLKFNESSTPKKRGRPPKVKEVEVSSQSEPETTPKKRGRPPKVKEVEVSSQSEPETTPKKRGRLSKADKWKRIQGNVEKAYAKHSNQGYYDSDRSESIKEILSKSLTGLLSKPNEKLTPIKSEKAPMTKKEYYESAEGQREMDRRVRSKKNQRTKRRNEKIKQTVNTAKGKFLDLSGNVVNAGKKARETFRESGAEQRLTNALANLGDRFRGGWNKAKENIKDTFNNRMNRY